MDALEEKVLEVVARETGRKASALSLDMTIERDLRTTGDDALELLETLHKEFGIDFTTMDFTRHFDPEVPRHSIAGAIWWAGGLVVTITTAMVIERTFGKMSKWSFFSVFVPFAIFWMWLARCRPDEKRRRAKKIPVTLRHLVEAARTKTWPFSYPEAPQ